MEGSYSMFKTPCCSLLLLVCGFVYCYVLVVVDAFCTLNNNNNVAHYRHPTPSSSLRRSSSLLKKYDGSKTKTCVRSSSTLVFDQEQKQLQQPQAVSTGFSNLPELQAAITDALRLAMEGIPSTQQHIDLCVVSVNSLYDGSSATSVPITVVVPFLLQEAIQKHNVEIWNVIGCTSAGLVSSSSAASSCQTTSTIEAEGSLGVSITLCIFPDVQISTFHVEHDAIPNDTTNLTPMEWCHAVFGEAATSKNNDAPSTLFVLPSPSFANKLDDFLRGLSYAMPTSQTFGAVASTVSSLSRPRLFQYSKEEATSKDATTTTAHGGRGCVGVLLHGDIQCDILIARGAKAVGGIYRVAVTEGGSIIRAVTLDQVVILPPETSSESESTIRNQKYYAARSGTPRPPLAEANYLLKNILSDDEASFMRRTLLVGVESSSSSSSSSSNSAPVDNDLGGLRRGEGYSYTVYQVSNAGMKDGSVTLPLGVNLHVGQRVRFFVREENYAKNELNALWTGYTKADTTAASGCFMFPSLDRGTKMFGGKPGYESGIVSTEFHIRSISGFFANDVIGPLNGVTSSTRTTNTNYNAPDEQQPAILHSSATCFAIIKSKSNRPVYVPVQAKENKQEAATTTKASLVIDEKSKSSSSLNNEGNAPRSPDGELILRRREIHSGRTLTVSTVAWSVAEKKAVPTSMLEGWMWEKETEVDRFRERVPLANLLSQVKQSMDSFSARKPQDWIGTTFPHSEELHFTIIPELKRSEPRHGALRSRYNASRLVEEFSGVATTLSVNSDGVMFGGSLEDMSIVRTVTTSPVLVSDLILYPYQLYQMRLAGADAVVFIAAALSAKDLSYLTKIASSLGLQSIVSVSSEVQLERVVAGGSSIASLVVSNRNWEDFAVDESGQQALRILRSESKASFQSKFPSVPILVEGRVGLIQKEGSATGYIKALRDSGASGAIVASALAATNSNTINGINLMWDARQISLFLPVTATSKCII